MPEPARLTGEFQMLISSKVYCLMLTMAQMVIWYDPVRIPKLAESSQVLQGATMHSSLLYPNKSSAKVVRRALPLCPH